MSAGTPLGEQISGVGIPWYRRDQYTRILRIMTDRDRLPAAFDAWEERAKQAEAHIKAAGKPCHRVYIDPDKFSAWCVIRGLNVDAEARMKLAADPANWPDKN